MRKRFIYSLAFVSALFTIAACNDDDEKPASLLGGWQGDKVEASVKVDGFPEPFVDSDEDFAGQAEFKSDGTVIFKEDGDITEGTWAQNAVVIANAAMALFCTGLYKDYDEAYRAAVESLESGAANKSLEKLLFMQ